MKRLILLIAVLGLSFFAYGAYIPAKAVLAQYLINDAWNDSISSGESHKPWKWADMHPVMKLSSEKHKQELIVLSGDKGNSLAFAPGYNLNSFMPNQGGTTVISAHRDTHFEFLQDISVSDVFELTDALGEDGVDALLADRERLADAEDAVEARVKDVPGGGGRAGWAAGGRRISGLRLSSESS